MTSLTRLLETVYRSLPAELNFTQDVGSDIDYEDAVEIFSDADSETDLPFNHKAQPAPISKGLSKPTRRIPGEQPLAHSVRDESRAGSETVARKAKATDDRINDFPPVDLVPQFGVNLRGEEGIGQGRSTERARRSRMGDPTLRYDFDSPGGKFRRHRHSVRRAKLVYDSAIMAEEAEQEAIEKALEEAAAARAASARAKEEALLAAAASKKDGKKGKPGKDKANPTSKQKTTPSPAPSKGKKDGKTPIPSPALPAEPPPIKPPIWLPENKFSLVMHENRPWIIEKKRPTNWFTVKNMTSEPTKPGAPPVCEPQPEPEKWTKSGERIAHRYQLRAVIKDPRTMELFFLQRKKRYVLSALRIFFLFAEQSTKMKVRIVTIPGLVRRLVQIIRFRTGLPQRLALMLLASLSEVRQLSGRLMQVGGYERIRGLFEIVNDPVVAVWLSLLVRNLSGIQYFQDQMLQVRLVEVVLDMVSKKEQDPDVVKYNLQTMVFLCAHSRTRKYFVLRGGFIAVIDLVFSRYRYIQYLTLMLLYKLLRTSSGKPIYRFFKADGLSLMIDFITNISNRKLFPIAIQIFEYIIQAPAVARKLQELSFYRILMEAATDKTYEAVDSLQEFALRMLARAGEKDDERRMMHTLVYEQNIVYFLQSNAVNIQIASLKAIAVLSRRPTNQEAFYRLGAHRIILMVMKNAGADVREWAFYAIAFLFFRNKQIINSFLAKGLTDIIKETLTDTENKETWDSKGNALLCAILLRKKPEIRRDLRLLISQLIPHWLVHDSERIRNYAAVSIGLFVTDSESREVFEENKGYRALSVTCMLDKGIEFLRNLCFGVAALVVDEKELWKLVNAGVLKPLFLLKNETDRVSQGYVGFAVHRIITLDRFFKYALLGRLDETDKLPHGLHDQGLINPTNPLYRIEFWLKQEPIGDRTVIYVSLPKKHWRRPPFTVCIIHSTVAQCSIPGVNSEARSNKPLGLRRLENSVPLQDLLPETVYNPSVPLDHELKMLMRRTRAAAAKLKSVVEKVRLLGKTVADWMGGPITREELFEDEVELYLSFLKEQIGSSCVPLGAIRKGNGLHRAMLFKVLADVSDFQCSLHRGDLGKGWNEITEKESTPPKSYIVDLLYDPGRLLSKDSPLGRDYISSPTKLPPAAGTATRPNYGTLDVRPTRNLMNLTRQYLIQSLDPPRFDRNRPEDGQVNVTPQGKKFRFFFDLQKKSTEDSVRHFRHGANLSEQIQSFGGYAATRRAVVAEKTTGRDGLESSLTKSEVPQPEVKGPVIAVSKERQASARKPHSVATKN